jgi:hypothetical protein
MVEANYSTAELPEDGVVERRRHSIRDGESLWFLLEARALPGGAVCARCSQPTADGFALVHAVMADGGDYSATVVLCPDCLRALAGMVS